MSETLREALTTIRDLTLDVPAAHGDPESYYLGQLRTAIGTAARALARSESPSPEGLTEAAFRERHRGRSCMGPCHKDTAARLRSSADSGTEGT